MPDDVKYVRWFENIKNTDVSDVGGKNASLGEMIGTLKGKGIKIPDGFATTSAAYWKFMKDNGFIPEIKKILNKLESGNKELSEAGKEIRKIITGGKFPEEVAEQIIEAYHELGIRYDRYEVDVAVRSSATAEDLPNASFAGQQESFLNISGEKELMNSCQRC